MENYTKKLVLEDGSQFYGYGFGADKVAVCELVFNTSVVGYQEILSEMNAPQMIVRQVDGRILRTWQEDGYSISLLFDARGLFLGVEDEQD